jgi:hypothetical protein
MNWGFAPRVSANEAVNAYEEEIELDAQEAERAAYGTKFIPEAVKAFNAQDAEIFQDDPDGTINGAKLAEIELDAQDALGTVSTVAAGGAQDALRANEALGTNVGTGANEAETATDAETALEAVTLRNDPDWIGYRFGAHDALTAYEAEIDALAKLVETTVSCAGVGAQDAEMATEADCTSPETADPWM